MLRSPAEMPQVAKTKQSRSAVPMAAELAQVLSEWQKTTAYGDPTDWVFASPRTHGRTPRVGNMLAADHLPASGNQGWGKSEAGAKIRVSQLASLAEHILDHREENRSAYRTGHSPPHQLHDNDGHLHAIAHGAANRRPGVGPQCDSEAADQKGAS